MGRKIKNLHYVNMPWQRFSPFFGLAVQKKIAPRRKQALNDNFPKTRGDGTKIRFTVSLQQLVERGGIGSINIIHRMPQLFASLGKDSCFTKCDKIESSVYPVLIVGRKRRGTFPDH